MEVSSHAISLMRIFGLSFDIGIFTILTHDHLDYHKSFKDYRDVKKTLFDTLDKSAFAITNTMIGMENTWFKILFVKPLHIL